MKKIFLLALSMALFACSNEPVPEKGEEGQSYVPAQSVDLDRDKLEMIVGDVVELRATVNPKDATNQNIEWDSSDLTVVAVRDGEVKAIGPGRAIVTVKTEDGGYTSECVVYVSPDVQTQKKGPMTLCLRYVSATSAVLSGFIDVEQLAGYDVSGGGVGFIYASSGTELDIDNAEKVAISSVDSENAFSKTLTGLKYDTRYVYTIFLRKNGIVQYGETQYFDTKEVTISVDQVSVTNTKATLTGKVVRLPEDSDVKVGLMYSSSNTFPSGSKSFTITPNTDGSYTQEITGLTVGATYYYRTYLYYGGKYDYGETKEFTTNAINVNLAVSSKTATTVTFSGKMDPVSEKSSVVIGVYVNTSETVNSSNYKKMMRAFDSDIAEDGTFSVTVTGLSMATQYYYTPFVHSNSTYSYGEIKDFSTENIQVTLSSKSSDITATTAKITGTITGLSDVDKSEIDDIGVAYSTSSSSLKSSSSTKKYATLSSGSTFAISLVNLNTGTRYYYCSYVKQNDSYTYGGTREFTTLDPYNAPADLNLASATDLSATFSANCYIVSKKGLYKFKAVKGNSTTTVGGVSSASILWETFGTSITPAMCDLIKAFCYKDGYIAFQTAETFKEGNAVIAAKDASGNILWSWHIWFTDQPQGQVYYNSAGTMMDRNLGATSATPGDVGALGLLYQWGRKDPFLGSSSISSSTLAKSTITWPSPVSTNSSRGTVSYVTANPTTFVYASSSPYDWHYSSRDNTLWTTSDKTKSIYDPCPVGWRVPDGGRNGIWSKAGFDDTTYDITNEGISFSISSSFTTWYPASGVRRYGDGSLGSVGVSGRYWSASPSSSSAYRLSFSDYGYVFPSEDDGRAYGYSVRCLRE